MLTDEQARDAVIVALDCTRERALELTDLLARVFRAKEGNGGYAGAVRVRFCHRWVSMPRQSL